MKNSAVRSISEKKVLNKTEQADLMDYVPADQFTIGILAAMDSPLQKRTIRFFKRVFDLVFSTLLLFPFIVLFPFIALWIKSGSKGPIFFLQKRNKKNGRVFTCIKFRTMKLNQDADLHPAVENDDRITRTGLFLRKYHLDELPQILNVWWGDMSIIGPRPHMISDNRRFTNMVENYNARHVVKPGITGLAQVMGYVGPVTELNDIRERVRNDIFYIRHWSLALEVRIIYRSILRVTGKT